jgi:hypothetical protein
VLANDGTTPKSTFHYQLGDNGLSFVKHMRNDTNIRLINTTNTDRYAILYTRDQSLYKLAFDSLKLEKIDINEVESDLYDMYAYNDTVLFVYGLSNSNNKIVCLYNIYDYEEVSREEVKSYQINRVNNSLYIVDLNSKERTIKLQ